MFVDSLIAFAASAASMTGITISPPITTAAVATRTIANTVEVVVVISLVSPHHHHFVLAYQRLCGGGPLRFPPLFKSPRAPLSRESLIAFAASASSMTGIIISPAIMTPAIAISTIAIVLFILLQVMCLFLLATDLIVTLFKFLVFYRLRMTATLDTKKLSTPLTISFRSGTDRPLAPVRTVLKGRGKREFI